MPGVFISYRRDDSSGYAGRIFDFLSAHFGRNNTFMDLDTIEAGDDFASVIVNRIGSADVLLAIIGDRWLASAPGKTTRRLDDPHDFVHIEIAKAIERGMRVIPVLVGGATMPLAENLPADLQPLCNRQAIEVRDSHFHQDAQQLADVLEGYLHSARSAQPKSNVKRLLPFLLSGAAVALIAGGFLLFRHAPTSAQPLATPLPNRPLAQNRKIRAEGDAEKAPVSAPASVAGKWRANIRYDWGDSYNEIFNFEVAGQDLSGDAGFLGDRDGDGRAIVQGKITGNRILFVTKTMTTGSEEKDVHTYRGVVEGNTIRFTLITESHVTEHTPVHFIAHRVAK